MDIKMIRISLLAVSMWADGLAGWIRANITESGINASVREKYSCGLQFVTRVLATFNQASNLFGLMWLE